MPIIIRKVILVVYLKPVVIIKRQILLSFSFSTEKLIPKHSRDSNPNSRPSHYLIGSGLKMSLNLHKRNGFLRKLLFCHRCLFVGIICTIFTSYHNFLSIMTHLRRTYQSSVTRKKSPNV